MHWHWTRLNELGAANLYDALALRARVFVVEQACAFQDPDGLDAASWHLLGRDAAGVLVGYLRVVDAGAIYAEPSIGRVVTAPEARGSGAGRVLFAEGLQRCLAAWPARGIRINAQAYLERFYGTFGFTRSAEPHVEDNILHVEMWRAP
jgi:ElaA protein